MSGHDYSASREHWSRVFAEPWAQEYLARCRAPLQSKTPGEKAPAGSEGKSPQTGG
jgi:hypothetical protein